MRVIIAGSRSVTEGQFNTAMINCLFADQITVVVSGTAKGADQLGEKWADVRGLEVHRFPADWNTHGKAAGPIRNRLMALKSDGLIAIWDGQSRGTLNMISIAKAVGLRIMIYRTDTHSWANIEPTGKIAEAWSK